MRKFLFIVVAASSLLSWPAYGLLAQVTDYDPIDMEDVDIVQRPNYEGAWWLFVRHTNTPVGYARWDAIQRRYTLFNLKNRYKGFYQATVGNERRLDYQPRWDEEDRPEERSQEYRQYVTYDKDNGYRGLIILTLGGRPAWPDVLPFGELGGQMALYRVGNIPLPPSRIVQPFVPSYRRMQDLTGEALGLPLR